MKRDLEPGEPHPRQWPKRWRGLLLSMWPQWPLACTLIITGAINLMVGIRYHSDLLAQLKTLSTLGQSLSVLGSRTQAFLGGGLMLVGFGVFRRLSVAWAFGVLFLAITVAVDLFQGQRGAAIILPAIMLLAMVIFKRSFMRRTVWASYIISLTGVLSILAYGTLGSYMLGQGFHPAIKDVTSALYFSGRQRSETENHGPGRRKLGPIHPPSQARPGRHRVCLGRRWQPSAGQHY